MISITPIFNKRMYTLYNTACCVNTAGYIHLGLHRVTTLIHMFPMSHKWLKLGIFRKDRRRKMWRICIDMCMLSPLAVYTPPLTGFARLRSLVNALLCAGECASSSRAYVFKYRWTRQTMCTTTYTKHNHRTQFLADWSPLIRDAPLKRLAGCTWRPAGTQFPQSIFWP
jgi:hypothetical protein